MKIFLIAVTLSLVMGLGCMSPTVYQPVGTMTDQQLLRHGYEVRAELDNLQRQDAGFRATNNWVWLGIIAPRMQNAQQEWINTQMELRSRGITP